ncbi:MAG: class I SAM-dependent methyltransferase [Candidatus Wallbacteria bacterium]|nr:class I SAM-dependent methyltransferase [Candidatus Wallbacteria bacterium]
MAADVVEILLRHCVLALGLRRGERCLDLGSGRGRMARELARAGARVVAADANSEALGVVGSEAKGTPHGAHAGGDPAPPWPASVARVAARAADLPFAARSFRTVACSYAFHHIHDLDSAFGEVGRVLAPGGRLAIIDGVAFGGDKVVSFLHRAFDIRDGGTHVRFVTLPRWRALMQLARLHLVRVEARSVTHDLELWSRRANQPEPPLDAIRAHFEAAAPVVRSALRMVPAAGLPVKFTTIEAVLIGVR